jgi:hypothetical protein
VLLLLLLLPCCTYCHRCRTLLLVLLLPGMIPSMQMT